MTEQDTHVTVDVEAPTELGWYSYSNGTEVMIFHLRKKPVFNELTNTHDAWVMQWSVHSDIGEAADCHWGYIEQGLSTYDLIKLEVPKPRAHNQAGDLLPQAGAVFRQVGWQINGGEDDGEIEPMRNDGFFESDSHGSYSPVYVEVGTQ
jgi:hypothetical protein